MRKNAGYTLVELLVVLGVTMLLSSLLIVYSREGERIGNIMRVRAQVVSDINYAKNLAITAREWNNQQTCGYGIYFDISNNRYIIFTDPSADCSASNHLRDASGNNDVLVINVPQKFQLKSANIEQVFFMPPDPTVFFDDMPAEDPVSPEEVLVDFFYQDELTPAFVVHINPIGQVWAY